MRPSVAFALVGLAACILGATPPHARAEDTVTSVKGSVSKLVSQSGVLFFNPSFHVKRDDMSVPAASGITAYDESAATHSDDPGGPSVTGAGNINQPNVVIGAMTADSSVHQRSMVVSSADTVVVSTSASAESRKTNVVQNCCFGPIASASTAFSVQIVITRRCHYSFNGTVSGFADDARGGVSATVRLEGTGIGNVIEGVPITFVGNGGGTVGPAASFSKSGVFEPGQIVLDLSLDCDLGRIDTTTFHGGFGSQVRASWNASFSLSPDEPGDDIRWTKRTGGSFGSDVNWDPQKVPAGAADNAIFDLRGGYAVDFGALMTSDRVTVRQGDVTFTNTNYTVDNPSTDAPSLVVGAGKLIVASGQLTSNSATIGDRPGPGAKMTVTGTGTQWGCQGLLRVGGSDAAAGNAELTISGGALVIGGAEVRLGAGAAQRALVTVDGKDTGWATGNIAVGYSSSAEFDVSGGAKVVSGEIHIGLSPPGSLGPICGVAGTDVDGVPSEWGGTIFRVGPNFGSVDVSDGGIVKVGDVVLGTGKVVVSGIEASHAKRSTFRCASLTIGDARLDVLDGGVALVTAGRAIIGPAGVSTFGSLNVKGTHSSGVPSTLETDGQLLIGDGDGGTGFLFVTDGAVVSCRNFAFVAASGTSQGSVLVSGGSTWTLNSLLGIGGEGVGEVLLDASTLTALGADIAVNSSLRGNGTVISSLPVIVHGSISPAIVQVVGPVPSKRAAGPRAKPVTPPGGTLTIQGDLFLDSTGVVRADAAGTQADRLVVTGNATLDGALVLQFKNGYAPKTGDQFEVLRVNGTVTGAFASVETRGLAPGSLFDFTTTAGAVKATAMNDTVALPTVGVKASAKKLLEKKAKKTKGVVTFARKGATTAPLVVHYTVGGTAANGLDCVSLPGVVTIPAKKKSVKVTVQIVDDPFHESTEALDVAVVPGTDYTQSLASSARIAIVDND